MFLIADSGSTKCNWVLLESNEREPIRFRTKGLNPSILKKEAIQKVFSENEIFTSFFNKVNFIYFFGSGCNTPNAIQLIEDILSSFLKMQPLLLKKIQWRQFGRLQKIRR